MKSIVGRKMGMTQVFAEDGTSYAVTVVEVTPNVVTQVKTVEHDGYSALQVGVEDTKESKLNKCEKGIFEKANVAPKKHLFEVKGDELASFVVGSEIKADLFTAGDIVDVVGVSKGRGFAGPIKRWHQKIGPKGHGSGAHRTIGSAANTGLGTNRIIPGKRMPGHMGHLSATVQNLLVIETSGEKGYILVKGGIPGPKKSFVTIKTASKTQFGKKQVVKPILDRSEKVEAAPATEAAQ
ncbi:MAG: 50S ribosomal protein L3 [Bacilli bacterium]